MSSGYEEAISSPLRLGSITMSREAMLAPSRLTLVRIRRVWISRPKSMVANPIISSTGRTNANSISATPRLRRRTADGDCVRGSVIEELVVIRNARLHVDAVPEQQRGDHGHCALERVSGPDAHVAAGPARVLGGLPPGGIAEVLAHRVDADLEIARPDRDRGLGADGLDDRVDPVEGNAVGIVDGPAHQREAHALAGRELQGVLDVEIAAEVHDEEHQHEEEREDEREIH